MPILAIFLAINSFAICQESLRPTDCAILKYSPRKVSCLCGTVDVCWADLCGSPLVYKLDDVIIVELRDKNGMVLDTQEAVMKVTEERGTTMDGSAVPYIHRERRFSFEGKPSASYKLAFILRKNGVAQPAVVFPTKFSSKRKDHGNPTYMVKVVCTN